MQQKERQGLRSHDAEVGSGGGDSCSSTSTPCRRVVPEERIARMPIQEWISSAGQPLAMKQERGVWPFCTPFALCFWLLVCVLDLTSVWWRNDGSETEDRDRRWSCGVAIATFCTALVALLAGRLRLQHWPATASAPERRLRCCCCVPFFCRSRRSPKVSKVSDISLADAADVEANGGSQTKVESSSGSDCCRCCSRGPHSICSRALVAWVAADVAAHVVLLLGVLAWLGLHATAVREPQVWVGLTSLLVLVALAVWAACSAAVVEDAPPKASAVPSLSSQGRWRPLFRDPTFSWEAARSPNTPTGGKTRSEIRQSGNSSSKWQSEFWDAANEIIGLNWVEKSKENTQQSRLSSKSSALSDVSSCGNKPRTRSKGKTGSDNSASALVRRSSVASDRSSLSDASAAGGKQPPARPSVCSSCSAFSDVSGAAPPTDQPAFAMRQASNGSTGRVSSAGSSTGSQAGAAAGRKMHRPSVSSAGSAFTDVTGRS